MKPGRLIAGGILLVLSGACAAADDLAAARRLAASCANCHGTNGAAAGPSIASLAGQPKDVLIKAMQEFKSGKRPASVMQQLAKGYSNEQIELVAGFFAQQAAPAK